MATIAKFYLHDTTTTNTGTMPTNSPAVIAGGVLGTGSEAAGASTARATSDVIGTANPDTKSVITSQAAATTQRLGHRRFVSSPLAATTFAAADGSWNFRYAFLESNANHAGGTDGPRVMVYLWRPSTGSQVGTITITMNQTLGMSTVEQTSQPTGSWTGTQAILDGDILVFDIYSDFTQLMATAYTDSFCYDGTVEASSTTCASFVSPPAALTLQTISVLAFPQKFNPIPFVSPGRI